MTPVPPLPRVAVLMATYNGAPWLLEQLDSIAGQQGVSVQLLVSDDESTDTTRTLLHEYSQTHTLPIHFCHPAARCGSAGQNFYHLLAHAPVGEAEYVSLSDQDDRWMPDKLARAIRTLSETGCSGYSSNVLAWWPGQAAMRLVHKAQPQVRYDHLFQGPGPGCTFLMTRVHFDALRQFLLENWADVQGVTYHDWLIYAHARETGLPWYIDPQPRMAYRQHAHNALGASMGRKGFLRRVRLLREGWLGDQTMRIARLFGQETCWPVNAFIRLHLADRLQLALHARQLRRGWRDRVALALSILFLLRRGVWK